MALGTIIAYVLIAVVIGLIVGALLTLFKIIYGEYKSKRDFKQGKFFELKKSPNEIIPEKLEEKSNVKEKKDEEENKNA